MSATFNPYDDTLNLPFFIAEIGINHNGDMEICKQLIDMAAASRKLGRLDATAKIVDHAMELIS